MELKLNEGYFITGTDTGIGKTYVSAVLYKGIKKYGGGYYKPVQSGCFYKNSRLTAPDIEFVCSFNDAEYDSSMGTYFLQEEVSPHLAAEIENTVINPERIKKDCEKFKERYKSIIAEGAGGLYVPLVRDKFYIYDLIKMLGFPVILVCSTKVGSVNHSLLTVRAMNEMKIKIHGIVFNNVSEVPEHFEKDNMEIILKESGIKNYLVIRKNQKEICEEKILKFLNIENNKEEENE